MTFRKNALAATALLVVVIVLASALVLRPVEAGDRHPAVPVVRMWVRRPR